MSEDQATYLGDGVYARFDGHMIELYTSNGIEESTPIFLERQVYDALCAYGARLWELTP